MTLTINQSAQSDHALRYTTDNYDEWATKLAYAGPVGAALGVGFMIARRVPMLIDFPVGLWDFFINDKMPEWMPSLSELMPEAKKHVVKRQLQIEAKQKTEAQQKEGREFYTTLRKSQQSASREIPDISTVTEIAEMLADKNRHNINHLLTMGISGDGKDVILRAILNEFKRLTPTAIVVTIDPKYMVNKFEYDHAPHFAGIKNALIGLSEAVEFAQARYDDPKFDAETAPIVVFVVTELQWVVKEYPECANKLMYLINVARGANVRLFANTQSYTAGGLGLEESNLDTFVKVVLRSLQPKYLERKTAEINKTIVSSLKAKAMSFAQADMLSAIVAAPGIVPYIKRVPMLKKAYQEKEKQLPPMDCPGLQWIGVKEVASFTPAPSFNEDDEDELLPEWESPEADAWILANKISPNPVGIGKAAKTFGVGVPKYYTRLAQLESAQNEANSE